MTRTSQSTTKSASGANVVTLGILAALIVGLLDVLGGQSLWQPHAVHATTTALALTTAAFLLAYLALLALVALPLSRILQRESSWLAVGIIVMLGVLFLGPRYHTGLHWPQSDAAWTTFAQRLLLAAAIMLPWILFASRSHQSAASGVGTLRATSATALLLALVFVFNALRQIWTDLNRETVGFWLLALVIGAVLLIGGWCMLRIRPPQLQKCVAAVLLLVLMMPFLSQHTGRPNRLRAAHAQTTTSLDVPRVILISIDALRPDHLSCYNRQALPTPHIDAIARESVVFENAYAPAPWTVPSVTSMHTGLCPLAHQTTDRLARVPDTLDTLAERMRAAGYYTGAVVWNAYLRPSTNLTQGFDQYISYPEHSARSFGARLRERLAPQTFHDIHGTVQVTKAAEQFLARHQQDSFFLWVHYYDPHSPYVSPAQYLPPGDPPASIGHSFSNIQGVRAGHFMPSQQERKWIAGIYNGEVRQVDHHVGRLLKHLRDANLYEDSLIIITSDHGEEFWDHGGIEHGHTLYNELTHVPLIVRLPKAAQHARCQTAVSIVSLLPTILTECDVAYDASALSAPALNAVWRRNATPPEVPPPLSTANNYYEDRIAVVFDGMKYIQSLVTGKEELYDLTEDPAEQFNIAHQRPDVVAHARQLVTRQATRARQLRTRLGVSKATADVGADTLDRLRSLGYIGS